MNFYRYQGLASGHAEFQRRKFPDRPILRREEIERRLAVEPTAQPVLAIEREWHKDSRPYYRVWPGILQPLLRLRLDRVECRHVRLPVHSICVEMPVGRSMSVDPRCANWWADREHELAPPFELATILAIQQRESIRLLINWSGATWLFAYYDLPLAGGNIEEAIPLAIRPMMADVPSIPTLERAGLIDVMRLLCMIALIRDDPSLVVPRVLAADQTNWEQTHDIALVAKSRRRGNVGWDLGREIPLPAEAPAEKPAAGEETARTVSPHYRHAHPALVWVGKRADPKPRIVLRRGSFVHGDAIADLPQGWYGDEAPPCPYCLLPMTRDAGRWHCEDCAAEHAPGAKFAGIDEGIRTAASDRRRGYDAAKPDKDYHGDHYRD